MTMANKTAGSTAPGSKIQDAQAAVSGRSNLGERVTTPKPGVGAPPKAVVGTKVAKTAVDMRDNDGDGGLPGMGPDGNGMLGRGGAC